MKKKVLGGIAVLAIATIAAFNVNINTQEDALSAITMDNVEALASESGYYYCRSAYVYVCSWIQPVLYGERINL